MDLCALSSLSCPLAPLPTCPPSPPHLAQSLAMGLLAAHARAVVEGRQPSEAVAALRPFLFERADHFWHEVAAFARSPWTMETYDRLATYQRHLPLQAVAGDAELVARGRRRSRWDQLPPAQQQQPSQRQQRPVHPAQILSVAEPGAPAAAEIPQCSHAHSPCRRSRCNGSSSQRERSRSRNRRREHSHSRSRRGPGEQRRHRCCKQRSPSRERWSAYREGADDGDDRWQAG